MERAAAGSKQPIRGRVLRQQARHARREYTAKVDMLLKEKVRSRQLLKKVHSNGRFTEDWDVSIKELAKHCTDIFDAADENH